MLKNIFQDLARGYFITDHSEVFFLCYCFIIICYYDMIITTGLTNIGVFNSLLWVHYFYKKKKTYNLRVV